ncbi:MAG: SagB/ThcOx family dehydrogenase [Candidatus Heimdallarchaeaceae archaeon]|jgi:SagB-type dehydrogenase family enzyme
MSFDRDIILKHRRILRVFDEDIEKFPEGFQTDQEKKIPNPPLQKPYSKEAKIIDLIAIDDIKCGKEIPLFFTLQMRRSHRTYTDTPLTFEEFSFLLWSTQGVHEVTKHHGAGTKRVVPSGGARHPFETYLIVTHVEGLDPGLYRYLAIEHKLQHLKNLGDREKELIEKISMQRFLSDFIVKGGVIFVWAAIPYRMEWRYTIASSKVIAIEAGHICQNLYLACEALGLGTCAIGAYNQDIVDTLLELDGEDEFTVYLSPVGKLN